MSLKLTPQSGGFVLAVKVVPNSSRGQIAGMLGEEIKIKVAQPPEDGKANKAVETLLAETLGVAAGSVRVIAGHSQPHKKVLIVGVTQEVIPAKVGR
jgi:uncharacterized protein (TIGR00251 family)